MRTFFSIILISIAGAVLLFYTRSAYDSVQILQTRAASYDEALAKAAELQKLKQELLSKFNAFNPADIKRLEKLLPDHVDNVALILDIDHLAQAHALALENVDVSAPAGATGKTQTASAIVSGDTSRKYDSLNLTFSTKGTYQHFVDFMRELQSSLRIVELTTLSITPGQSTGGSADLIYAYKVSLRTYWLK